MAEEGPINFKEVMDNLLKDDRPVVEQEVVPVVEVEGMGLSSLLG